MSLIPLTLRDQFLGLYPAALRQEVEVGLRSLEPAAAQVGIELLQVEEGNVRYADAIRNEARFPYLSRFHHAIFDLLQFELPAMMVEQVRAILHEMAAEDLAGLRRDLFMVTASATGVVGAFFRAMFIEALWHNVALGAWQDGGKREASGCMDLAFDRAQELLERARTDALLREPGVRPLEVLVASLQEFVEHVWEQIAPQIVEQSQDAQRRFRAACQAEEQARGLGAQDAAIVRGLGEGIRTEEPILSQRQVDRHPQLFASVNAVDQRVHRLVERRIARKGAKPVGTRLLDLLVEILPEEV